MLFMLLLTNENGQDQAFRKEVDAGLQSMLNGIPVGMRNRSAEVPES